MNIVMKSRWLAALRSGAYAQGQGRLQRIREDGKPIPPQFCCLGVLCDIAKPDGWRFGAQPHHTWGSTKIYDDGLAALGLGPAEQDWLIRLNDVENKPFPAIADWIETNL